MVWPFSGNGGGNGSGSSKAAELDPTLQDFVKAQGPVSYSMSAQPELQETKEQDQKQSQLPRASASSSSSWWWWGSSSSAASATSGQASSLYTDTAASSLPSSSDTAKAPVVPTLFPDGRYAHIWRGYRPLAAVEAENKTSAEKIADVLLSYNDRDNSVKKAGLENCWPEGLAAQRCNQNPPTAHDRFTLCRDYTRRLERCYVTQVRFLRALGYLTEPGRSQDTEEDIQLHADDLYRRMLEQERMVEEAERDGKPRPVFAPVLASEISRMAGSKPVVVGHTTDPHPAGTGDLSTYLHSPTLDDAKDEPDNPALPPEARSVSEKTKNNMRDRLKKIESGEERAIERLAMANEIRASNKAAGLYSEMALEQKAERERRRQNGTASIGDRVSGWLGW